MIDTRMEPRFQSSRVRFQSSAIPHGIPIARGIHALSAVVGRRQNIVCPEELLRRIVDQHGIVRHGAAIVIQIMRTLGLGVVGAAVDCEITVVVNGELVLVEMLMLGEIRTAIELDPGGVRLPAIPHHKLADTGEIPLPRQLAFTRQRRIARHNLRIIPQKFQDRQHPLLGRETALPQKPRTVRILESVYGIAQTRLNRASPARAILDLLPRRRAIGKKFVEVRVPMLRNTEKWAAGSNSGVVRCDSASNISDAHVMRM